jgi:predicted MPP superfamily phosphohydrolase
MKKFMRWSIIVIIILGLFYSYQIEPFLLKVKKVKIESTEVTSYLGGEKIVLVSDLHISRFGNREKRISSILNKIDPDILFLTGDYIEFGADFKPVMEFFKKLPDRAQTFAVLGNSDYSNEKGTCILCHMPNSKRLAFGNKVQFLRNQSILLPVNNRKSPTKDNSKLKMINIIGLDDPVTGKADFDKSMKNVSKLYPTILISHSPQIFTEAVKRQINLVLCGHTHGGQLFFVPLFRELILHNCYKYNKGFYISENTIMFVTSGIGTSFLPFRLGVIPEIVLLEFK